MLSSPIVTICPEISPTGVSPVPFALTVTAMLWVAVALLGSVAVTVIVADPSATGVTVTVALDTLTVALALSDEDAE